MALICAYTDERYGETYNNAYHRICRRIMDNPAFGVLGNPPEKSVLMEVETWGRQAAKTNGKQPLIRRAFVMAGADADAGVSQAACYDYLKTLPEFTGAIDA